MKALQINTTQNVKINFELASVGQRILAFSVDNIIKFTYLYLLIELFDYNLLKSAVDGDYWSFKAIKILVILPLTFYSLYSEILLNGQTIGKKLLKIKVVNIDGFKPSNLDYIIRWFLRIVDFNLFTLLFVYMASLGLSDNYPLLSFIFIFGKLIGLLCISFTKNNQRLGDISANTVVISLKDEIKFSQTILEEISVDYQPSYPNVIKLSDNDARIIKDTYSVAAKSKDYATLIKLRSKIEEVTGISSVEKSDIIFIDKVLKDYNYYTQNM